MSGRVFAGMIYLLSGLIGVLAFVYPFLDLQGAASAQSTTLSTPLLTTGLVVLCLLALMVEIQGEATSAKVVAALGMLVSATSVLRFVETAIPGPGGFSPIFAPVILAGYVFGARFGFLMGSLTLLVSALITGGVGPWLPYQMFVAGWVGFTAGLLPHPSKPRLELLVLLLAGAVWGILFGLITNLYFWPFFSGEMHQSWTLGAGLVVNTRRYLAFYGATSLLWDLARATGNVLLLLVLGMPAVRALTRFRDRFQFTLRPVDARRLEPAAGSTQRDGGRDPMKRRMFDPRSWLIWVVAAAATTMLTRNPLYTVLLLLVSRLVDQVCADEGEPLQLPLVRLGVLVLLFSSAFNALFVHQGQTVLFRLPAAWPLIGGPITLEAAVFGLESGLILLTLLSLFLAFNRIVPVSELARLTPRAFQDLGVVVLIALTYLPETMRHMQRIREAQAVRGHRTKGIRDWRPLVVPLLIGSLERAMSLAEAMVARGYGVSTGKRQSRTVLGTLALGLGLILSGWVMALWWGAGGWAMLGLGAILVGVTVWRRGRSVKSRRYRENGWQVQDWMLLSTALLPLLAAIVLPVLGQGSLYYNPYPALSPPPFDPLMGTILLCYLAPAFYRLLQSQAMVKESYD